MDLSTYIDHLIARLGSAEELPRAYAVTCLLTKGDLSQEQVRKLVERFLVEESLRVQSGIGQLLVENYQMITLGEAQALDHARLDRRLAARADELAASVLARFAFHNPELSEAQRWWGGALPTFAEEPNTLEQPQYAPVPPEDHFAIESLGEPAGSTNRVVLVGRLTRDPELRKTTSGMSVCAFSIAVPKRIKPQDGSSDADFFRVTAWGLTAEFVSNNGTKGRLVAVDGRLQSRKWTDQQGNSRETVEVVVENVQLLGRPKDDGQFSGGHGGAQTTPVWTGLSIGEFDPFADE